MFEMIKKFLEDDEGASMAEYAILVAAISGAMAAIIGLYTSSIGNVFSFVREQFEVARRAAGS